MTQARGSSWTLDWHLRNPLWDLICCGAPGSGTKPYSGCMNWLFGDYFLWWNTFLSFDTGERRLASLCIPDFIDSWRRPSSLWEMVVGAGWRNGKSERKGGEGGRTGFISKMKFCIWKISTMIMNYCSVVVITAFLW